MRTKLKKSLSMLLALVMLAGLLPTAAFAAGEHGDHCICGGNVTTGGHVHGTSVPFTAFDQTSFETQRIGPIYAGGSGSAYEVYTECSVVTNGNYYLTDNVALTMPLLIGGGVTVTLCLHGHTLSGSGLRTMFVMNGGTLNICDCSGDDSGTVNFANLTSGNSTGISLQPDTTNTLNIYGGTLSGGSDNRRVAGSAYCYVGNSKNMRLDCTFYGGKTDFATHAFYLIVDFAQSGSNTLNMNIYDGVFTQKAYDFFHSAPRGNNVDDDDVKASFTMTGGTMTVPGSGQAVIIRTHDPVVLGGNAIIQSNRTTSGVGRAVMVRDFTMRDDAKITCNDPSKEVLSLCWLSDTPGTVSITDNAQVQGKITLDPVSRDYTLAIDDNAKVDEVSVEGGILAISGNANVGTVSFTEGALSGVQPFKQVTLSGTPTVDVVLKSGQMLEYSDISGIAGKDHNVCIVKGDSNEEFIRGLTQEQLNALNLKTSDGSYPVKKTVNGQEIWVLETPHTHAEGFNDAEYNITTDKKFVKNIPVSADMYPDGRCTLEAGNYYLTSDVTLPGTIVIPANAKVCIDLCDYTLTGSGTTGAMIENNGEPHIMTCSQDAAQNGKLIVPDSYEKGIVNNGTMTVKYLDLNQREIEDFKNFQFSSAVGIENNVDATLNLLSSVSFKGDTGIKNNGTLHIGSATTPCYLYFDKTGVENKGILNIHKTHLVPNVRVENTTITGIVQNDPSAQTQVPSGGELKFRTLY